MTKDEKVALQKAVTCFLNDEEHQGRFGSLYIEQLERIEVILSWIDTPNFYEAIRYEEREHACPTCKGTGRQHRGLFSFNCFGYFKKKKQRN